MMDVGDDTLPDSINPNNFPAKLWRLVNNPTNKAIHWDSLGQIVIIDQQLFEAQILSPSSTTQDNADGFKTHNFSSFVRQLNLYGFRKADINVKERNSGSGGDNGTYHHFYNPNFQRNHPELVANLRRLTVDNKAKMQAGLNVNCRPPSRFMRHSGDGKCIKRGNSSPGLPHQESAHPYCPRKADPMTAHSGTPVPPRYLMRGYGTGVSPTVFATDKGIPALLSHQYSGGAPGSNGVHIQQDLLVRANNGNPSFTAVPQNAQYQPRYQSPVWQCYHPNLVASHMAGGGPPTGPFPPHSYFQGGYPVTVLCYGNQHQDLQNKANQEGKRGDINLDTVFQIADEVMQTPPNSCPVKVPTPERPGPVAELPSNIPNPMMCYSPAREIKANPCTGPIIMAVSGNANRDAFRQEEESVVSVPEQMPEDDIFEVISDEAKHTEVMEVIEVKVSVSPSDPSQA